MYHAIIVGAGPAGLSAALVLGRCCRSVAIFDTGEYRNSAAQALHGFLTRDGIAPTDFLRFACDQLAQYTTVSLRKEEVVDASRVHGGFEVELASGGHVRCRKLLLATGVVDSLPALEGVEHMFGRSVFHCPYCDGWEFRNQPLGVYGRGERGKGLAVELTAWSRDLVLCTDGPSELEEHDLKRLHQHGITVREDRVARLEGDDGRLERIVFVTGESLARRALFFNIGEHQRSSLAARLGCEFTEKGAVATGKYEATKIAGLFVAGDASRAVQLVVVAAAEGAEAAFAINTALLKEDLTREESLLVSA